MCVRSAGCVATPPPPPSHAPTATNKRVAKMNGSCPTAVAAATTLVQKTVEQLTSSIKASRIDKHLPVAALSVSLAACSANLGLSPCGSSSVFSGMKKCDFYLNSSLQYMQSRLLSSRGGRATAGINLTLGLGIYTSKAY